MKLTQTDVIRVDFDFRGRAGYAIARRDGTLTLPDNFELAFRVKGDALPNTLEVKFVQGDNVWWTTRREYDFPADWRRVSIKKRQLEFAWGPAGPSPLPKTVDAIELVVTAGSGGKGTVWFKDIELNPISGEIQEIGGIVLEKPDAAGKTWIPMPDADARDVRVDVPYRTLPPFKDDNAFFTEMAKHHRRGLFPRYFLGEQSYWTILGGTNGEEEEALFSEDGAIEAGAARYSIEPFLWMDGKLITWNDVAIEQREGPQVVWKKHLTITPRYENGKLKVRYQVAPNAKLLLAVRPFQVNPQWQFLNRTGGVVRTKDATNLLNTGTSFTKTSLPETQVAGDFASKLVELNGTDITIEIPLSCHAERSRGTPCVDPSPRFAGDPSTALGMTRFRLDLPAEPRIARTIAAQLNYILLNKDGPAIHPGSRSYERSWIRDGSLTSEALLRLGQYDVVKQFIEWYAKAIREDGYVPCCVSAAGADPVPEHDSHGQFIYLVAEYYRHTGDRALVERMLPTIRKVVAFIDKLRRERMTERYAGTAFYGMVPESISHEGYSAKPMHSYWDTLFILKGLEDAEFLEASVAGSSLLVQGHSSRKGTSNQQPVTSNEFRTHLLASIAKTMQQHRIDYIPGSVELGDFDATSTTVAVTPVDADLPAEALHRTFEKYWEQALEPRTYTPYELRVVGTLVRLGHAEKARRLLDYFFEDQRPAAWYQWAEVVRANPREGGFIGDMPHTWVGSDFIRSAIDLLAYEDDGALILGAGIAPEWARQGVRVENLSTHYGSLTYELAGQTLRIGGKLRVPPKGIVVKSPYGGADVIVRSVPAEIT
ncbi:MAG TPA: amylo-alpha-1,6-glucosidase, partial [Thermoanaerobaculia bacterium]|nr:amylo-alpha-1,6-glucosidase [Thermoanaerobaculia bacterium]